MSAPLDRIPPASDHNSEPRLSSAARKSLESVVEADGWVSRSEVKVRGCPSMFSKLFSFHRLSLDEFYISLIPTSRDLRWLSSKPTLTVSPFLAPERGVWAAPDQGKLTRTILSENKQLIYQINFLSLVVSQSILFSQDDGNCWGSYNSLMLGAG